MDRYNATLTAMCEVIEDAIANGLHASDVPNLVANTIDELEGRAELRFPRFVVSHDAPARMKEAAR
ncbi:hypothetical protein [Paracoccus sp. SM22M-07]|uniref:hypothetical protein n=1 Tax=Paracoccus sp. SM22M-07 TaxID=1520813 RepID=UPI00091E0E42|nr:hypothetical protein [Paracoccus sp. SM22M-07]OJH45165.1 hypothetical protein IE00_05735 [Paracoccus sp. SM22M-07]